MAQRLDEEVHRVQSYLHPSTLPRLTKKLEDVLIRDRLDVIYEESKILLRDDRYQGKDFYHLRITDCFLLFRFESFI